MSKTDPVIMVIEDEALLLEAISKKLKIMNFNVVSCTDGNQAIDYLNHLGELPDAIWLDYYLKDINGVEFMKKLNVNASWAAIPVFVVSNSASPDKVKTMLSLGAIKYLLKAEYHLDEIINMIGDYISGKEESTKAS